MPHRLFVLLFGILFIGLLPGSARQSPDKIWHKLDSIQNYRTEFTYTVTLPLTDSEINYRAELSYRKNPIDTLCGYSYLIDYKAENDTCPYANFMAYDNGDYFRFDRDRLREYHHREDKEPFAHRGNNPGVHRSGLFTELFPAEISRQLKTFVGKKDCLVQFFPDTLVQDRLCDAILVNDSVKGELSRTILYTFDTHDGMPLYRETENNPGHLGSQTVTVKYSGNDTDTKFPSDYFGETNLLKNYGEIFLRFREGTYAASDRVGQKSPEFSHKWGEHRFSSDQLKGQNCLLLFLDERGEFCKQALQIAEFVSLKENLTPVILYIEKQPENIENRSGAIILEYTGKTASEYGVTGYPTLFLLDPEGTIRFVKIGYSPLLAEELELAVRQILHDRPIQAQKNK